MGPKLYVTIINKQPHSSTLSYTVIDKSKSKFFLLSSQWPGKINNVPVNQCAKDLLHNLAHAAYVKEK